MSNIVLKWLKIRIDELLQGDERISDSSFCINGSKTRPVDLFKNYSISVLCSTVDKEKRHYFPYYGGYGAGFKMLKKNPDLRDNFELDKKYTLR